MAGVESIISRILSDAHSREAEIIDSAKQEAGEILANAKKQAAREREAIMAQAEKDAKRAQERAVAAAKMEGKKRILAEKQSILNETFTEAARELASLPDAEYASFLTELIALNGVGGEEILLCASDKARVDGKKLVSEANRIHAERGGAAGFTLSEDTVPARGGVVLRRGDVEVNCTLEMLLAAKREELEQELAAILFH